MPEGQLQVDEILLPLLDASGESEAERLITEIISKHAEPVIRDIIKYKLGRSSNAADHERLAADAEDIYHDAVTQLLERLSKFKADPARNSIGQLHSYAAVITYHSYYRHLRQVYPQRHILKNRLRYLLTRQAGFSLWEGTNKESMCGFDLWRGGGRAAAHSGRIDEIIADPAILERVGVNTSDIKSIKPSDLLAAVFTYLEGPVALDVLVKIVARLWGIKDQEAVPEAELAEDEVPAGEQADPGAQLARRDYLQKLWREVCQLPPGQRAALLLNLRGADGSGCIELFPFAGVATIEQIARALEIPAEEFAALWNELPLDDQLIAKRLGIERQQVINLRKSARARLSRRVRNFE
jgi:DNA-directed RNA polymerase specialized sigma24 family protein